jgi:hypothetical protein
VVAGAAGFDAGAGVVGAPLEVAPSVPDVAGAGLELDVVSALDFFSASIPFFRPSEG